jgi:hypothetical protein
MLSLRRDNQRRRDATMDPLPEPGRMGAVYRVRQGTAQDIEGGLQ